MSQLGQWGQRYEEKRLAAEAEKRRVQSGKPEPLEIWDGDKLMAATFDPERWLVEQILPEGFALLVADSKVGKGWVAYALARAVETGGVVLDRYRANKFPVIYLDLEHTKGRSQRRWRKILREGESLSPAIHFAYRFPRMGAGGLEALDKLVSETGAKLVIVDVIECLLPETPTGGGNASQQESRMLRQLQYFAADRQICLLGLHHENASGGVSGTSAMRSVPDILWYMKRPDGAKTATLRIKGRAVADLTAELAWWPEAWAWRIATVSGDEEDRFKSDEGGNNW